MADPKIQGVGDRMLAGTPWRIRIVDGTYICLELCGKRSDPFHPDDAIDIALAMFAAAKKVKRLRGMPITVHGLGDLTDAVADERRIQKTRDSTAIFGKFHR